MKKLFFLLIMAGVIKGAAQEFSGYDPNKTTFRDSFAKTRGAIAPQIIAKMRALESEQKQASSNLEERVAKLEALLTAANNKIAVLEERIKKLEDKK